MLANLIQNALTHSARAVTLQFRVRRNASGILFTVADNGPGIPSEYQEVIFRKFEQVRTPHAPRVRKLGPGASVLPAGRRAARRPHLGAEQRGGGERVSFPAAGRSPGPGGRRKVIFRGMTTVYIETYGCQMNVSDSELMLGKLMANGYTPVDGPDGPM